MTDTTDIVQRLQICGQYTYHDDAIFYGTVDALRQLRQVLDDAIDKGEGSADFVPSDGEGYQVFAFVRSGEEMDAIPPTYSFLTENSLQAIENATQAARIAELEKDAQRYRWLRGPSQIPSDSLINKVGAQFDAAIDSAMERK